MEDKEKPKPKPRRPKGDGSILEISKGKYKVQITIDGIGGEQRRKSVTVEGQKNAVKALDELKKQNGKGLLKPGNSYTVTQYIQRWLESKKTQLRESTYLCYVHVCTKHIEPTLGKYKVQKLTTGIINDYFNVKVAYGLSPTSLGKHREAIHNMLNLAVDEGIIGINPASRSNPLKRPMKTMHILSQTQITTLLEAARGCLSSRREMLRAAYYLILLALATGMRLGELLGLQWDCVGLDNVKVIRSLSKEGSLESPKSNSSIRTISVDAKVLEELQSINLGNPLVFHNATGKPLLTTNASALYREVLALSGIKGVRFHDLRHTHATQLIAEGCNIKMVSERLGHSSVGITLQLYVHSVPEQDKTAAAIMGKLLGLSKE